MQRNTYTLKRNTMKSKITALFSLVFLLMLPLCRGQTTGGQWLPADDTFYSITELQKFSNMKGVPFYVDRHTGRVLVDIGTNLTFTGTVNTATNNDVRLVGATIRIDVSQTNAPSVKMNFGGMCLAFPGSTNTPTQVTNATTRVRWVTYADYSNFLANAGTVWLSVTGSGGPWYPILSTGEKTVAAPANMDFDLTNHWIVHRSTNDAVNAAWGY